MKFPATNEFLAVDKILKQTLYGQKLKPGVLGPGDDCAVLGEWLISTDISVEGTHFRLDWSTLEDALHKAYFANLSDINAMGGIAEYVFFQLSVGKSWPTNSIEIISQTMRKLLEETGVVLLGGDTVSGTEGALGFTVLGRMPSGATPLLRSTVKEGDWIYLVGDPGLSRCGLEQLIRNDLFDETTLQRHRTPQPPLQIGPYLSQNKLANAAIDVSDGLSNELHHLALSSGVSIEVDMEAMYLHPALVQAGKRWGIDPWEWCISGGEDYLLLFSSSISPSLLVFSVNDIPVRCIGKAKSGQGVYLKYSSGNTIPLVSKAWSNL